MPDHAYVLSGVLIAAAITWTLRALPFAVLAPLRDSRLLAFLGLRMPVGIMIILTVYTLVDLDPGSARSAGPVLAGLAVTIGLHLWKNNMTLSIFGGTAIYVLIASLLASGTL